MTKRKAIIVQSSISGLVNDFYSIAQELRDELQEWKDNIEEKFSGTDKFSRLEEAVNTLEEFCENEPDTDLPECNEDFERTIWPSKKKMSRADRMGEAMDSANAAVARLTELKEALEAKEEARVKADLDTQDAPTDGHPDAGEEIDPTSYDDLISDLGDHIGTAENVEFPGMFG